MTVEIRNLRKGSLHNSMCNRLRHIKMLPCLSIVQALEGAYEVRLDNGSLQRVEAGAAFIAPRYVRQDITHYVSESSGYMSARWIFLEVTVEGAYLEDELFLMEYFANVHRLAVTDKPLYRYLENPASATHRYMRDYPAVFARFLERKAEIVEKYGLDAARPQWRANTVWAGLLIAVGNEYVKSNPKPVREKRKAVEALCAQPEFAKAIRELRPKGLGRNKQIVADLIGSGRFGTLTALYRLKNHM